MGSSLKVNLYRVGAHHVTSTDEPALPELASVCVIVAAVGEAEAGEPPTQCACSCQLAKSAIHKPQIGQKNPHVYLSKRLIQGHGLYRAKKRTHRPPIRPKKESL